MTGNHRLKILPISFYDIVTVKQLGVTRVVSSSPLPKLSTTLLLKCFKCFNEVRAFSLGVRRGVSTPQDSFFYCSNHLRSCLVLTAGGRKPWAEVCFQKVGVLVYRYLHNLRWFCSLASNRGFDLQMPLGSCRVKDRWWRVG